MITLFLNGAPHPISPESSIADLLAQLDLLHTPIAVAVNRRIIHRQNWAQHPLQSHDYVDIVQAIGGG